MQEFLLFVKNHWTLWLALVLVIILLVMEEFKAKLQGGQSISPQDLIQKINRDQAVVIDTREKAAYDSGHIVGAINLSATELDNKKLEKYKDKALVLCSNGPTLLKAINQLRSLGFNVYLLAGGLNAWQNAGLPLTKK